MGKKQNLPMEANSSHQHCQAILLVMGKWRHKLDDEKRKLIIAEALNDCVWNHDLFIKGYLITNSRIYLVLNISIGELHDKLLHFYHSVKCRLKKIGSNLQGYDDSNEAEIPGHPLFAKFELLDEQVINLLTGKKVTIKYTDPQLTRFEDEFRNSKYCSAIDFSGALGPVYISFIK